MSVYKIPGVYKGESLYNGKTAYNAPSVYTQEAQPTPTGVEVGGIKYPFAKIGKLLWTTLSLRNETAHYVTPQSGVKDYGVLYQYYYVNSEIKPLLPAGWRIPTLNDIKDLYDSVSHNSNDFISSEKGGNNSSGFSAMLLGYRNSSNNFVYNNSKTLFWSDTPYGDNFTTYNGALTLNAEFNWRDYSRGTASSVENTALEVRICSGSLF